VSEDYSTTTPEISQTRPITIALERLDETKNGDFRPGAFVKLTSDFRTCGFLASLPAEDVKNLLFLLTFLTPNGDIQPTVDQLAEAMQVSQAKVRSRMQRLERFRWQDKPSVVLLQSETGLDRYTIAPHLIMVQEAPSQALETAPPIQAAGREAIIAYSREHYARPRAEVERLIAEQNGWELPEGSVDEETADARRRLLSVGVTKDQADFLLGSFEVERIQRQLEWLPYRNARNPASLLVAAIEHDYEEPFDLRLQHLTNGAEGVQTPDETGADTAPGPELDTG
jgi:hypothetical protein